MLNRGRSRNLAVAIQLIALSSFTLCSCKAVMDTGSSTLKLAGSVIVFAGKVVLTTGKVAWAVVKTTAKLGGGVVRFFTGKKTVKLEREGNSLYVKARLNKKHKARLLLDTGATSVQISSRLANKMGLDLSRGERVRCTLADGSVKYAKVVELKEVRVGGARVKKVKALVLEHDAVEDSDGLLGMSFLNNFHFELDTDRDLLILKCKPKE